MAPVVWLREVGGDYVTRIGRHVLRRVRMDDGTWYLRGYRDGERVRWSGPGTYSNAEREGERLARAILEADTEEG